MTLNFKWCTMLVILVIITAPTLQNPDCMVDKCKFCDFKNVYTCNECEGSYYLVTFYGTEKGKNYHACWKKMWLYFAIWCLLYCPCLYGLCCYALYRKAQTVIMGPTVSGGVEVQKNIEAPVQAKQNSVNFTEAQTTNQPTVNVQSGQQQPTAPINIGNYSVEPRHPQISQTPQITQNYPQKNQSQFVGAQHPQQNQSTSMTRGPITQSNVPGYLSPSRQVISQNPGQFYSQSPNATYGAPQQKVVRRVIPERSFHASPVSNPGGNIKIIEKDPTLIIERSPSNNSRAHAYRPLGAGY